MFCNDYISVGKKDDLDWSILKPMVIDTICDHFTKNLELFDSTIERTTVRSKINIIGHRI